MKTLYITDLDGTFLDPSAHVSHNSAKIINKLISDGLLFTIATARTYATVIPLFSEVNLKLPLVLMNGVCIYDPVKKKTLAIHGIEPQIGKDVQSIFSKFSKYPLFYFENDSKMTVRYEHIDNKYIKNYIGEREAFFNKTFEEVSPLDFEKEKLVYIVTLDKKENLQEIYSKMRLLPGLDCNFYLDNYTDCFFLEAMAAGRNKASGAAEVKKMLGIDKIVAFGDNINDIPLFRFADECYAVGNACEELKAIATRVIESNNKDAVARFIEKKFYEVKE